MRQLLAPAAHVLQTTLLAVSATFEITRNQFYSSYPHLMYIYVLNYDIYNYIYIIIYTYYDDCYYYILLLFLFHDIHIILIIYIFPMLVTHIISAWLKWLPWLPWLAHQMPMACWSNPHPPFITGENRIYRRLIQ